MEATYKHAAAKAIDFPSSFNLNSGCHDSSHSPLLGHPKLLSAQQVFSRAYDLLIKHKSQEKLLLDIPFNLCLLLLERRPAFLIQADNRCTHLRASIDACLQDLSSVFATIHTYQGQLVCLQSRAYDIRQTILDDGSCSCFGRVLGYPFAGELDEIHCCSGRFRVNLKISTRGMEVETGQAASFMAMVGCQNHCVSEIMKMALDFQSVASEISPALRVSFLVDLYNDDPQERPATRHGLEQPSAPTVAGRKEHHSDCTIGQVAPCHWPSQAQRAFVRGSGHSRYCESVTKRDGMTGGKMHRVVGKAGKGLTAVQTSDPKTIKRSTSAVDLQPCTVTPREFNGWKME